MTPPTPSEALADELGKCELHITYHGRQAFHHGKVLVPEALLMRVVESLRAGPQEGMVQKETRELAKEMYLTCVGNRGYNLTITSGRVLEVCRALLQTSEPDWLAAASSGGKVKA